MSSATYYAANKDKIKARSTAYALAHPDRVAEYKRNHYLRNRQVMNASSKSWVRNNPDRSKDIKTRWRVANKAKAIASTRRWQKLNTKSVNAAARRYQIRHPGEVNYQNRMRELTQKRATPPWLSDNDKLKIKKLYIEAARISSKTGVKYHVDHIYPLQGKTCCGLHVPWNLQILLGSVNIAKRNKLPAYRR